MRIYLKPASIWTIFFFYLLTLISSCGKKDSGVGPVIPPPADTTPVSAKKWIVTTIAGNVDTGSADGIGLNARFNHPESLTIDGSGTLYVSDLLNFNIRKITTPGNSVSTYAGRSVYNPPLQWGNFFGIVADNSQNVFLVEYDLIYKIQSPTTGYDFAGSLAIDYIDGQGTNAAFNAILNIAKDDQDNLYLPDYDRNYQPQIRKITTSGTVSTIVIQPNNLYVGSYSASGGYVHSITLDHSGNIYVTANTNNSIIKINQQGVASLLAGSLSPIEQGLGDGQGANARFSGISGMVADSLGNLFVTDGINNVIRKVTVGGNVTTIAGTGAIGFADGDGTQALFYLPIGIVIDKNGIIYVADSGNNCIRKLEYK